MQRPRLGASLVLLLLATAVGCERAEEQPPPLTGEPPEAAPTLYPVEIEPGLALAVRKTGPREYMMYGATDRTAELQLSVEDGHNILFGPVEVGVVNQRFRVDFIIDPTDRDHIFFYITDAEGQRLAVVPVDTARALTTAGPEEELPEPPELGAAAGGDRRTHVSGQGLESPHFRLRWPEVVEGSRVVRLEGETDLPRFHAEVRRYDSRLAVRSPRVSGPTGEWNAFATELVLPGGLREGDAVVLAVVADADTAELIFQPIPN